MLFRKEVTEYQQTREAGQVLLLSGWPLWVTVSVTLLIVVTVIAFLTFGTYTRRVTVAGEITTWPHTVNLFAPEQGVVSRLLVTTGQVVRAGTPLYQLDTSRVSPEGNLSVTTYALLDKQLHQAGDVIAQLQKNRQATLEGLKQQLEQTIQARETSEQMVSSATQGMTFMRHSMENYDKYRQRGLITTDQQNNQRYLYYQQQSVWHSLNSQRLQQEQQILSLRSELLTRAADFDSQIAQYRIRREDTARQMAEASAAGSRLVTAPAAGRVSSLSVTEGQMVSAGDSLAQLVPAGNPRLSLVLWLPGESIPWVHPGDPINIRYSAWPSAKFGQFPGTIVSVPSAPASPAELSAWTSAPRRENGQPSEGWFRVLADIQPDSMVRQGKSLSLTAGMQAQVTLFLEARPLWQWMFAPYQMLRDSVTGPVHDKK